MSYDSSLDTFNHIRDVQENLAWVINLLIERGINHDDSKLHEPEKSIFDKMETLTYGSDEYKAALVELGEALSHHYEQNSHHPEHYEAGIAGMDLLDIIEMLCDWKAATKRHDDGDILKSLEINANRFGIDDQLKQILLNTVYRLDWVSS